jgi:hypothetical protein
MIVSDVDDLRRLAFEHLWAVGKSAGNGSHLPRNMSYLKISDSRHTLIVNKIYLCR